MPALERLVLKLPDSLPLTARLTIVGTALKLGSNQCRSAEGLPIPERSVRIWPAPWARSFRFLKLVSFWPHEGCVWESIHKLGFRNSEVGSRRGSKLTIERRTSGSGQRKEQAWLPG